MRTADRSRPSTPPGSAFAGFRFPPDVIVLAVRWYLRFGLSYRDVEELLTERRIEVDHVTIYRWVQRSRHCWPRPPAVPARRGRSLVGRRDLREGRRSMALRLPCGQVIDVFVSPHGNVKAARRFFQRAIATPKATPVEVVTDRAATYPVVLEELLRAPWHRTEQYANNRVETNHGRLKSRLGPMRGLNQDRSAR
jgi:transposase, IS6 family